MMPQMPRWATEPFSSASHCLTGRTRAATNKATVSAASAIHFHLFLSALGIYRCHPIRSLFWGYRRAREGALVRTFFDESALHFGKPEGTGSHQVTSCQPEVEDCGEHCATVLESARRGYDRWRQRDHLTHLRHSP